MKNYRSSKVVTSKYSSPCGLKDSCWKGYKAKGKKPSPSGKKVNGKIKMVNNCVKE